MKNTNLKKGLEDFNETEEPKKECSGEQCEVKDSKKGEIVEKLHKKMVISDGRQLLREITFEN